VRIACRAFNCHRLLWPQIRRLPGLRLYQYLSHKFLRWLSGYFIISATLAVLGMLWVGLGPKAALAGLAALGLLVLGMVTVRTGPLGALGDALTAIMATAWGVVRSLQGQRFQTWNVAARHNEDRPAA
jgi:hypothetical protein